MRMKRGAAWTAAAIMVAATGCGGPATDTPPAASPTTAASSTAPPTPRPTPPSKAEDTAALKRATVTAADLGQPWVEPKKVPSAGKAAEACPGKPTATKQVDTVASFRRDLTEGKGQGVNIGSFALRTLPTDDATDLKAAYAKDTAACKTFTDANKLFVVLTEEGPTSADNADEILMSRADRIYYDKAHKKLAYARHTVVARTGRVVSYVSYAFLTTKADPKAEDFTRTQKLLATQLTKVTKEFAE